MMLMYALACQSQTSDWWQNENANPYPVSQEAEGGEGVEGGEGGEGGDEEAGFFGLITEENGIYVGENAVEAAGCMWYVDITAEEVEPCSQCTFAVRITYEDPHIGEESDCPEGHLPEDHIDTQPVIGFGNGLAWVQQGENWEDFALYFQEDVYHIWYVSF